MTSLINALDETPSGYFQDIAGVSAGPSETTKNILQQTWDIVLASQAPESDLHIKLEKGSDEVKNLITARNLAVDVFADAVRKWLETRQQSSRPQIDGGIDLEGTELVDGDAFVTFNAFNPAHHRGYGLDNGYKILHDQYTIQEEKTDRADPNDLKFLKEFEEFKEVVRLAHELTTAEKVLNLQLVKEDAPQIGSKDAIVDDNSFIQMVVDGIIPEFADGGNKNPTAIRCFLCAKCVYLAYLSNVYQVELKRVAKGIRKERISINSKQQSYREANLKVESTVTPIMKNLVTKQSMLQRVINEINKNYKQTVINESRYNTPFGLWTGLQADVITDENGELTEPDETYLKFSTEKTRYKVQLKLGGVGAVGLKLQNLSGKYQKIVNDVGGESLNFSTETLETTKYEIAIGAKEMMDSGVDPEVRYKFYRMATSFALAPFTMFKTMSMNIALMGPPGTGKSTLASKIGKFAYALGWLTSDEIVEPKASELISNVRGQTALNTRAYLNASLGRLCFIDEAYALTPQGDASGKEFADELTEFLTNHKGMLMVIAAGYQDEMTNDFFASNVGLPRRFPTKIILGVKTPRQCFNAFMWQLTEKMGVKGSAVGTVNNSTNSFKQSPFFIIQAAIWIPIFTLLLGKRFKGVGMEEDEDDPVNLLKYYFSDIELIAEIYMRYLMSEGLFYKRKKGKKFGGDILAGIKITTPFKMSNIIEQVLNNWLSTRIGENTKIESIDIGNTKFVMPVEDLTDQKFQLYKKVVNEGDDIDDVKKVLTFSKELLGSRICAWPVLLMPKNIGVPGEVALKCYTSVNITFIARNTAAPGKVPFPGAYYWRSSISDINNASDGSSHPLIDHHAHVRIQAKQDRAIEKKHKQQQQQRIQRIERIYQENPLLFPNGIDTLTSDYDIEKSLKDIEDTLKNQDNVQYLIEKVSQLDGKNQELQNRLDNLPASSDSSDSDDSSASDDSSSEAGDGDDDGDDGDDDGDDAVKRKKRTVLDEAIPIATAKDNDARSARALKRINKLKTTARAARTFGSINNDVVKRKKRTVLDEAIPIATTKDKDARSARALKRISKLKTAARLFGLIKKSANDRASVREKKKTVMGELTGGPPDATESSEGEPVAPSLYQQWYKGRSVQKINGRTFLTETPKETKDKGRPLNF